MTHHGIVFVQPLASTMIDLHGVMAPKLHSSSSIESTFQYVSCVRITATGFLQTRHVIGGDDVTFYARIRHCPKRI